MLDPSDVNDIPNLVGSGILEQSNGAVVQVSGKMDAWKLKQIYNLVKTATTGIPDEPLKKITIQFEGHHYIIVFDDSLIYVSLIDASAT